MAKSDVGTYEKLVYQRLNDFENLRDDASLLYASCVSAIRGKEYIRTKTLFEFFAVDSKNKNLPKIPTMSSVVRLNTKLQKEYPHLRGKYWEKRQKHSKDYEEDLGYGR